MTTLQTFGVLCIFLIHILTSIISYKELYFIIKGYINKNYIYGNKEHSIEHIEYMATYIIMTIGTYIWIFHQGIYNTLIINSYIIPFALTIPPTVHLLHHAIKERVEGLKHN